MGRPLIGLAAWFRQRRAIWRANGLCIRCGHERDGRHGTCRKCRFAQAETYQRRKAKREQVAA